MVSTQVLQEGTLPLQVLRPTGYTGYTLPLQVLRPTGYTVSQLGKPISPTLAKNLFKIRIAMTFSRHVL